MSRQIRIAILGTKFMGRAHSNAWRQVQPFFQPELEPVMAVACGRDPESTEAFARQWGWQEAATDWREVIQRDDIDIIDLSLPQHLQAEIAIEAAKHGKHLFCEKPMAMTHEEAMAMADAAEQAGVVHFVNYNYRRAPAVALARRIIDEGRLGEIRHWRGAYLQQSLVDPAAPMRWKMKKEFAGSGPHGDLNSHSVDLAHYLVGPITSVSCQTETFVHERPVELGSSDMDTVDVDDASQMQVRFENGALGSFEATRYATGRYNGNQFEIFGSRGALRWSLEDLNRLEFFSMDDPPHLRGYRSIIACGPDQPYGDKWWPPGHILGYEHTFVHSAADFLAAIAGDRSIKPDFREGAEVLRVLEAGLESAQSGSGVDLS